MIFCSLYSGSSGNSIFISSEKSKILIDAGLSGKSIELALSRIRESPSSIDGIFVTHEHIDHIKGVGVLSRKYDIPIYANHQTWNTMEKNIGKIKEHNIKILDKKSVVLNDMEINPFDISHDAACPFGYTVCSKNKKASIATDLGFFSKDIKNILEDCDVILLESNHDTEMLKFGPYPYTLKRRILSNVGHLSNEDCGRAIINITNSKYKNIILGHLSKTNNFPELAYQTVLNALNSSDIRVGKELSLSVAKRDTPSNYIKF
ncbi:MBL fold metallo-hydrolase [Clostridium sporogenes]|uniref:MBL fold metallo-hydrolase n=1 Tax=Clostridium botulinum TaxID=1491 RepID=A0A6M0T072_CLOBO|nr:MBL fold metallo-hydrolase [Clostridium sporogenes]NFA61157.1 MBL fold metallo-hydrolase [Clostridium botulinum]NFI75073.1 MBL fold metallo-hydrolase [Clostridium sporogenes]NFL72009.1 MBL fold metallo-hydrolase [Clostridium sporogenes]NFM25041.1 MBL fold metallo-hydrolase [Clostridium sporogenes]NFP63266.1 MBL fold metallo-hydrolase [Clostridium sporogenes]